MSERRDNIDLEMFRQAMKDNSLHTSFATVISVNITPDRSAMKATVQLLPTLYEARVFVGAEYVAPGVGVYYPLRQNDLVVVAFPQADRDKGIVIKRLSSKEDTIPQEFNNDKIVIKCMGSEEFVVVGDNIKLGSPAASENLVLGQVLKSLLSSTYQEIAVHKHIGNLGYFTAPPDNTAFFLTKKASPIEDEGILSDIAKTEKS